MNRRIITIDDVTMKYGKEYAINNVSLNLSSNRIVGLCGPNGAGKTTLIKMIVGLIRSYDGIIKING